MSWLKCALVALPLALPAAPAAATASLTCDIDDQNVQVTLQGNIGRGDAPAVQINDGSIKLKPAGRNKALEFPVKAGQLVQQWTFGKELRLGLLTEEVDGISVYLAIIAEQIKSEDVDRYRGRYVLKMQGPNMSRELRGRIKECEAG